MIGEFGKKGVESLGLLFWIRKELEGGKVIKKFL